MKGKQEVRAEADERSAPSAHIVYEAIRIEGEEEIERRVSSLAWSAFAAGLSMGFSFVSESLLQNYLPAAPWRPLVSKLGYSVGFLIVVLGRQQLFTENTLTPILPLLVRKTMRVFLSVARLWAIVLSANMAGALLFAFVLAKTRLFDADIHHTFEQIGREAIGQSFAVTTLRAVFAGWLIALMVWLLPVAQSARIWVIIILTYLVGLCHFPHIIAGSIETYYLALIGAASWTEVLGSYVLPALIGNTVGGVALVAVLAHAQIAGDKDKEREGS